MYDRACVVCQEQIIDCWEPMTAPEVKCARCGEGTKRVMLPSRRAVIGDDIPGGILIHNGICHDDGTPKRYYSKSAIKAAAEAKGLTPMDHHVSLPGTDKNPNCPKWS